MEVDERYTVGTHWKRIARFILPGLKMHCLSGSDTEDNPQNFGITHSLGESGVEAGAALLDKGKVKARSKGDHLEVGSDAVLRGIGYGTPHSVGIILGDCPMLSDIQTCDRLLEHKIGVEIGIVSVISIPTPK